jgi:hypothetical protein
VGVKKNACRRSIASGVGGPLLFAPSDLFCRDQSIRKQLKMADQTWSSALIEFEEVSDAKKTKGLTDGKVKHNAETRQFDIPVCYGQLFVPFWLPQ